MSVSGSISLRLPRETLEKLDKLSDREHKDRSTLIRELLDRGIKEKDIEHAVESYRTGQTTGWRSAQLAGTSLWNFYRTLDQRGVPIQYSEHDLEEDLKALTEE